MPTARWGWPALGTIRSVEAMVAIAKASTHPDRSCPARITLPR
jgi:hypothetical protein